MAFDLGRDASGLDLVADAPPPPTVGRQWGRLFSRRRVRRHRGIVVTAAAVWMLLLIIVSLTVQWFPIAAPGISVGSINKTPNWSAEFLGTDAAGRSMLSRLLFGARTSLMISAAAASIGLVVGSLFGLLSAYFGGPIAVLGDIVANTILAIPGLVLLLGIVIALGSSMQTIIFACGFVFIPQYLRLARAEASRQLARDYIVAARSVGSTSRRIIFKELLPNTAPSLISYTVLVLSAIVVTEGALSFLGFGVQSPTPSWGNMISLGNQYLSVYPWGCLLPCFFFFITIFSMLTLGDYLRGRLAPRGSVEN